MIERRKAVYIIFAQFVIFMFLLGGGLQLVKVQAREAAAQKATEVAHLAAEVNIYQTNRTTCAMRAWVVPQTNDLRKLKAGYLKASRDTTANAAARARNAKRAADTQTSINNAEVFLNAYGTIPPDFDCSTLPDKPPTAGD